MFDANYKLVGAVYWGRFSGVPARERDDLMQEGAIGLWRACETWDARKGRFSTYAYTCIYRRMLLHLRKVKKEGRLKSVSLDGLREVGFDAESGCDVFDSVVGREVLREVFDKAGGDEILCRSLLGDKGVAIAKDLGVSKATVSRKISKFRKEVLDNYTYENGDIQGKDWR